jgi:hypothetical protein
MKNELTPQQERAAREKLVAWATPWIEQALALCYLPAIERGHSAAPTADIEYILRRANFETETIRYAVSVLLARRFVESPAGLAMPRGAASRFKLTTRGLAALFKHQRRSFNPNGTQATA